MFIFVQNALVNYNLAFMRKTKLAFKKKSTHGAPRGEKENA